MKKLFTLVAIVFTCSTAFAQRSIDLQTTLVTPAVNGTITHNTPFNLSFTLKNNGTDAAQAGDTITMAILVDNNILSVFQSVVQNSNFAKDSIVTYTINNYSLTFNSSANGTHQFCAYAIIENGSDIADPVNGNNLSCNSVTFAGGVNGIGEINKLVATDITAFPVPASKDLTLSYNLVKENNVTVKIYDIQGRELMNVLDAKQGAGNQIVSVNTSSLKTGVYFYELNIGGNIARTKFVVAN